MKDETLDGTTRSYSRTTWQCFPSERAHCIEGPDRQPSSAGSIAVAVAVLVIVGLIAINSLGVLK